jgi:hypothetical protein
MDIVSGATSIHALKSLFENGVQCRYLPSGPKFHAKVYIFGEKHAVVTSANLTKNALDSNIEVGTELAGEVVGELAKWFDACWDKAIVLDASQIAAWECQTVELRHEYTTLRNKATNIELNLPHNELPAEIPQDISSLRKKLNDENGLPQSHRYFLCNTDRKHGRPTSSGKYKREELMQIRSYAAAWEDFKFPSHMDKVASGNLIFMYANQVGIIGIGVAKGGREILPSDAPGRILYEEETTPEWRIPVDWLVWVSDDQAAPWKPHDVRTFLDVSEHLYDDRREGVIKHFESLKNES